MIHLICGPIGAGKTTAAIRLAKEQKAIRFSEDEWLAKLFIPSAPVDLMQQPMEVISAWASRHYPLCRSQIWSVAKQLLQQGTPVVLDGAAANKLERDAIRDKANKLGVSFQLHYICCDSEIRKQRVAERNNKKGDTYSMHVPDKMFNAMEGFFQAPVGAELDDASTITANNNE